MSKVTVIWFEGSAALLPLYQPGMAKPMPAPPPPAPPKTPTPGSAGGRGRGTGGGLLISKDDGHLKMMHVPPGTDHMFIPLELGEYNSAFSSAFD